MAHHHLPGTSGTTSLLLTTLSTRTLLHAKPCLNDELPTRGEAKLQRTVQVAAWHELLQGPLQRAAASGMKLATALIQAVEHGNEA